MSDFIDSAPGAPGISPRWTSSAKEGVGTALSPDSPIWFTLSHGIVNEVYYPRVDSACIRDFGLVVTGPNGAFFEEKRHATSVIASAEPGVPAFQVVNKIAGAFRIEKDLITDPDRPVLLTRVTFSPLSGNVESWHVHALISPHLVNAGAHNSAWLGRYDGHEVLFAKGRGRYLALASSLGWRARSAGYVGGSDGWQQLRARGRLEPQ
jgi:glucoamylase